MAEKRLIPVSIDLLYDGMVVMCDVFDHTVTHLLIRKGKFLTASTIESIRRINGGNENVYVTEEIYNDLMRRSLENKVRVREDLEEYTGYAHIKEETLAYLQEIDDKSKKVPPDVLISVAEKLSEKLEETSSDVIIDLISSLAPVDEYLQRHSINVSLLNGLMGKWLNLPKDNVDTLVLIGLLHDCGKSLLPKQVLSMSRPLSIVEFEVVKMHALTCIELLSEFPETVRQGVCAHHERFNGLGYPEGLSGHNIPFFGRITALTDIYDAMTSRRSYKMPLSPFAVMAYLKKISGVDLDPMLVETFLNHMPNELMDKPVVLSNGDVGITVSVDPKEMEYPLVKVRNKYIKTNKDISCVSMFYEEATG
jgi:HD-GYP domain-containing protein (c-di-GMP phosphodiesterase class II)